MDRESEVRYEIAAQRKRDALVWIILALSALLILQIFRFLGGKEGYDASYYPEYSVEKNMERVATEEEIAEFARVYNPSLTYKHVEERMHHFVDDKYNASRDTITEYSEDGSAIVIQKVRVRVFDNTRKTRETDLAPNDDVPSVQGITGVYMEKDGRFIAESKDGLKKHIMIVNADGLIEEYYRTERDAAGRIVTSLRRGNYNPLNDIVVELD